MINDNENETENEKQIGQIWPQFGPPILKGEVNFEGEDSGI